MHNKEFVIKDATCSDSKTISDSFNNHFVKKPVTIHDNIKPSNSQYLHLVETNRNSIFFKPITLQEISSKIRAIKKEGDRNDVTRKFLKLSLNYVSELLCDLYNRCVREGVYPDCFKTAKELLCTRKDHQI